jgi:hypothetical protein
MDSAPVPKKDSSTLSDSVLVDRGVMSRWTVLIDQASVQIRENDDDAAAKRLSIVWKEIFKIMHSR